jgi:nucleoid-associated protein YgaU
LLACAAGLGAAACAGWLGLVLALASARLLPSALGRVAGLIGDAVTPPLLRRGLAVALGAGLAFGAAPAPAGAGTRPAPSPTPTTTSTAVPVVVLDRPAAPPAASAPNRDTTVTVRPGDSLWSIAAHSLGPAATTRDVARAWPAWWAANRTVVGPDPDLIFPGQRLTPPPDPSAHLETR